MFNHFHKTLPVFGYSITLHLFASILKLQIEMATSTWFLVMAAIISATGKNARHLLSQMRQRQNGMR
jgi:hypothetical protein